MKITVLVLFVLVGVGCGAERECSGRHDNIVGVYMHEQGVYSFMQINQKTKVVSEVELRCKWPNRCVFVADVPVDQPMWLNYVITTTDTRGCEAIGGGEGKTEVHIHAASDITGGGWDHGKSGRGQTSVIATD